jgi:hypothetical protein
LRIDAAITLSERAIARNDELDVPANGGFRRLSRDKRLVPDSAGGPHKQPLLKKNRMVYETSIMLPVRY